MAITTAAQLSAALAAPVHVPFSRSSFSMATSYAWKASTWALGVTGIPAHGAPTTASALDATSAGAMTIPGDLAAGQSWYLAGITLASNAQAGVTLLDRFAQSAGLAVTTTAAQAVTLQLPSRATTDVSYPGGPQIYLEIYGASGTAITSVQVSYTNSSGVPDRTGTLPQTLPTTTSASGFTFGPMHLQAGDTGVSSVQSLTFGNAGTGPALAVLVLAMPVAVVQVSAVTAETRLSWHDVGLVNLGTSPCLYWNFSCGANPSSLMADLTLVQG